MSDSPSIEKPLLKTDKITTTKNVLFSEMQFGRLVSGAINHEETWLTTDKLIAIILPNI